MQVTNGATRVAQQNAEMMRVIQAAQQTNNDMANKMIRLSIEQKVAGQKNTIANAMVDLYM